MKKILTGLILVTGIYINSYAQQIFPKITGYAGIMHPIVSISRDKPHYNFDGTYTGGLVTGINLWKNARIGFSMELVGFVRAADSKSKMSNFLFHPGALFTLGNGFTLATRAAFETSGRYGFTPVLNKVIIKNKLSAWYVAIPVPVRFGNELPVSLSPGIQLGIAF